MVYIDCRNKSITEINRQIRLFSVKEEEIVIENPDARHLLCVGLLKSVGNIKICGSAGYFCAGLSDGPIIEVLNNVGWAVADNLLSGTVIVNQNASAIPGVAMRGGTLVVRGNIGSRAGQVMKAGLILAKGSANFMPGYMMMGGRIIICGDCGSGVGQNIINGEIYVGGRIENLGNDAEIVDMSAKENEEIRELLDKYFIPAPSKFVKITSAKKLHHYSKYEPGEKKDISTTIIRKSSVSFGRVWNKQIIDDIITKSEIGRYRVRGFGALRELPNFDEIGFRFDPKVIETMSNVRKHVNLQTTLGGKFGGKPLKLSIPIMIAPMSYGALSKNFKIALATASTLAGTATNTGEGGMMPEERAAASQMIYQCLSGRFFNPYDMLKADAIEIYISQGAKPGLGGQLMGKKITSEISRIRGIPPGIDLRSPSRHPDVLGADDLVIKIEEFREATDWKIPISLKIGAGRLKDDIKICLKDKIDFVEIDGMQGGTGASPEVVTENVGIPTLSAIIQAIDGLKEMNQENGLQIVLMGGIKDGIDAAKAIALGAHAVSIGTSAMIAGGCIACMKCHIGDCPQGIATQDPELVKAIDIKKTAQCIANFLEAMATEIAAITLACGKSDVHELNRSDLIALTSRASAITELSLVNSTS